MISEKQLRDLFEQWTGYPVKLYHGEVEESYRVINDVREPVNAVMEVDAWTYTPIRTVAMATTAATVTVIARSNEDAEKVRAHINEALEEIRGSQIRVQDDDGKTFALSVMAGSAYRDEAVHGTLYGYGDEYDVLVRLEYIATANGISSADTALLIDGEQVELENMMSSMVSATEEHPGDDGVTLTATPSKTFQIEAAAVLLDNGAGAILTREALSLADPATVHCVEYRVNNVPRYYMMVFTRCQLGSSELNNVGVNLSLATANTDAVEFDASWSSVKNAGLTASIGAETGTIVFWGDHTADRVGSGGMVSHVYTDGRDDHTIHTYGRYDKPLTRALRVGDNLAGKHLIYVGDEWDVSGLPDSTEISCGASRLAIESGYLRELRDDDTPLVTITDRIEKGHEWISSLDVVTGIRDESLWHVCVAEMGA